LRWRIASWRQWHERAGLVLVQTALVGSILADSLLVLGLAFTAGGLRHGAQRFGRESVRMIATLLVLAVPALAIPALATAPGAPDAGHPRDLSIVCAVVLLVVCACSIPFSIRGGRGATVLPAPTGIIWPTPLAVGMLAAAGIAAAFVSDWFVEARWGPPVAI
jgi:Ca2+:H+ antiporter